MLLRLSLDGLYLLGWHSAPLDGASRPLCILGYTRGSYDSLFFFPFALKVGAIFPRLPVRPVDVAHLETVDVPGEIAMLSAPFAKLIILATCQRKRLIEATIRHELSRH